MCMAMDRRSEDLRLCYTPVMKNRHYGWWYRLSPCHVQLRPRSFLHTQRSGRARSVEGRKKRKKKKIREKIHTRYGNTLNSTFAIMRVCGYVNVRGTLITHTRCTIPRGCSRKSSLFFRQANNEWTPGDSGEFDSLSLCLSLLLSRVQLKQETRRQGGKALRCKTRFANISGYVAKFSTVRRNRLLQREACIFFFSIRYFNYPLLAFYPSRLLLTPFEVFVSYRSTFS